MRKKKPRKQMRMNRRRMKAEINRLRNNEKRLFTKTIPIETLRTERFINIFDAGSNEFASIIQREMVQEICNAPSGKRVYHFQNSGRAYFVRSETYCIY